MSAQERTPAQPLDQLRASSVAGDWASFREQVLHVDSPPQQVVDMRRAFYAGAAAAVAMFWIIGLPEVPEEVGVDALQRWIDETEAFARDVAAGRA